VKPGVLERLDNIINPIVVKELRQAVAGRLVSAVLLLFLTVSVLVLVAGVWDADTSRLDAGAGQKVMQGLNAILLVTCVIILPLATAARMANEWSESNVDLMFITTIRPRAIIWGKLAAALVIAVLIYTACMPFMTLTYLLRGIDLPTIFFVLSLGFMAVILSLAASVFVACAATGRGFRVMLTVALIGGLILLVSSMVQLCDDLVRIGIGDEMDHWEFWVGAGVLVAVFLSACSLLYVWSVALISPPSANRMLPVRLTMTAVWLVITVIAAISAIAFHNPFTGGRGDSTPLVIWVIGSAIFFGIGMFIAIGEREQWAKRVAVTIPRNPFGRTLALLLYSGSAGGILWSWIMIGISVALVPAIARIGAAFWNVDLYNKYHELPIDDGVYIAQALGTGLYIYCYAMTALMLRKHVLGRFVAPAQTWSLALVIGALACATPLLVAIFVHGGRWYQDEIWLIANPASLFDNDTTLRQNALLFTGFWAALVTIIWVPSFVQQVGRFRRYEESPDG
jgi:hypothetical protein